MSEKQLEKYQILDEIGHGGMATVYRARDTRLDRDVAVKVMHPHLRGAREARARFAREARTVAKLKHENVLEIYDYSGEDSEESYIATELLTGPTLKVFVEQHPDIPPEIAACFAIEVARALAVAHKNGIVHRDVKPENVLLHENRAVKLTDFGIAQMVDAQSMTATGQILGSPGHMAPEQITGGDCDQRTDLFSLGTVLYYLATGALPFTGKNPHQVLKRIVEGVYADPLRVRPAIGGKLRAIIVKSLSTAPEARYATAGIFEEELKAFVRDLGIDDPSALLHRYLKDPSGVSAELRTLTITKLTAMGELAANEGDVPQALDCFNRVLAIDESNARVLSLLQQVGRASRRKQGAIVLVTIFGTLALGGIGYAAVTSGRRTPPADTLGHVATATTQVDTHATPRLHRGPSAARSGSAGEGPALVSTTGPGPSRSPGGLAGTALAGTRATGDQAVQRVVPHMVSPPLPTGPRTVVFGEISPQNVSIGVDGAAPRPFGPSFRQVELMPGVHRFELVGSRECCVDQTFSVNVPAGNTPYIFSKSLRFREARLYVTANVPADVSVSGGVRGRTREILAVEVDSLTQTRSISVTAPGHRAYTSDVRLVAGQVVELPVALARADVVP